MADGDLITDIQRRAHLRSAAEATRLLEGVLQALAHVLPADARDAVCACVPAESAWCLDCGPRTPDPLINSELFLGWVMSGIETTAGPDQTLGGEDPLATLAGDEARERVRAVLEALWEQMGTPSAAVVAACLPAGLVSVGGPDRT